MPFTSTTIESLTVRSLRAPLLVPFTIATGRHDRLDNLLVHAVLSGGAEGWGEAAVATHITGETLGGTRENIRAVAERLRGRNAAEAGRWRQVLADELKEPNAAWAAVEMALLDALARAAGVPLWKFFGARRRLLRSDITVVLGDLRSASSFTRHAARRGFRTFKVKVGAGLELDRERILAVRDAARSAGLSRPKLILDANEGYDAAGALKLARASLRDGVRIAALEQPVPRDDWKGLAAVARGAGVPVIADESVRNLKDAVKLRERKSAHGYNIKLMKSGLVHAAMLARYAREQGLLTMMGGMMESLLAMTAAAHVAAGAGGFTFIDLDTPFFVKGRPMRGRVLRPDGVYDLGTVRAGIGVTPTPRA